ncbi:MAG: DUF4056 domain-containing protein [Phycisphaerales bacterium]
MRCCRYGGLVVLWFVILVSVSGCRSALFFTTAAISQRTLWHAAREGPGPWTFDGLDPHVPPRIRPGCYASATRSVHFLDAEDLGPHSYRFRWSERNGIAYTCRGGHIDVAHVRKGADCTGYLAAVTLQHLKKGETRFRYRLIEPTVYFVTLTLPPGWDGLEEAERERIARDVSVRVGQHLAFTALTWHEIITWFGYRPRPHVSEFPSAFSWEDTYSNLLGVHIAAEALEREGCTFDEAMTVALKEHLDDLGGEPAEVARQAAESVRGQWYTGNWLGTAVRMRHLDLGFDDGSVTPCLVPSVAGCEGAQGCPLAIPSLDYLADHGFSLRVEMDPKVWEMRKIRKVLKAAGCPPVERLDPAVHFPLIMDYIAASIARSDDLAEMRP